LALNNTHPETIEGTIWTITDEPLSTPDSVLPYFSGLKPDLAGRGPPVYTFLLPEADEQDPVAAMLHPENHKVRVGYRTFYPYNLGKHVQLLLGTLFGNHVGDWEGMYITFDHGVPSTVRIAYHDKTTVLNFTDPRLQKTNGTHPIVYSATGSHGLWTTAGLHVYETLLNLSDSTSAGTAWDTWRNNKVILPSDWISMGSGSTNWTNVTRSWVTDINKWGNQARECIKIKGVVDECRLNAGPSFPLHSSEVGDIMDMLKHKGLICGGYSVEGTCVWPMGPNFSVL